MKYQVHPSDDGRWFILNPVTGVVMSYVGNELLARKIARILNETPGDPLVNLQYDLTKLH